MGINSQAQGPGGIDTTNMTLWVRSDTGVIFDVDSNVTRWTDFSNYGNHLDSAGLGKMPNFIYQSATYNNQNVVMFSVDSGDVLKSDAFSAPYDMTGGGWSLFLFFLYNKGSSQTGAGWFSAADALSAPKIQLNLNGNNFQLRGDAASNKVSLGSSVFTEPIVYSLVRDVAAGTIITNQNGTQDANKTLAGTAAYQADLFKLGEDYAGLSFSEMQVTEVIFLNRTATTMEVKMIENYFSSKYGGVLTGNDLYIGDALAQGDYDYDIAGVGTDGTTTKDSSSGAGLKAKINSGFSTSDYFFYGHKVTENTRNTSDTAGIGGTGTLAARFERVWYFDNTNTTAGDNLVDLTFDLSDAGYDGSVTPSTAGNYILIYRATDGSGTWTVVDTAVSITDGDKINFTGVNLATNGDGYYTLATKDASVSPLPVEMVSFKGAFSNGIVNLNWVTASEINNQYFEVQRSIDGINWSWVGVVAGSGNTVNLTQYSFVDKYPLQGLTYYRLKQVDIDGNYHLSKIIKVINTHNQVVYNIKPNPSKGIFEIVGNVNSPEKIVLLNSVGAKVSFNYVIKESSISINAETLQAGVYTLLIPTVEGYQSKKIVIQP